MAQQKHSSRMERPGAMSAPVTAFVPQSIGLEMPIAVNKIADSASSERAKLVSSQMPGWKIVPDEKIVFTRLEDDMKSDQGPSIADLRRKFLAEDDVDSLSGDVFSDIDESVETVRIQPRRGGAAKTADIKNGQVSIVQG